MRLTEYAIISRVANDKEKVVGKAANKDQRFAIPAKDTLTFDIVDVLSYREDNRPFLNVAFYSCLRDR